MLQNPAPGCLKTPAHESVQQYVGGSGLLQLTVREFKADAEPGDAHKWKGMILPNLILQSHPLCTYTPMLYLKSWPAGTQIHLQYLQVYLGKYICNLKGIIVLIFSFTWNLGA